MKTTWSYLTIFSLLFLALIHVKANMGEFNQHWKQRAEAAKAHALAAYVEDPEAETEIFNAEVHMAIEQDNTTRRNLRARKHREACEATNPIDRCWRCDPKWAVHRKRLARCAKGFGHNAGGGKDGEFYVVTSSADDDLVNPKPGTLRHAVTRNRPLWIIFARSMVIRPIQELIVASNKTIDGRGCVVEIAYGGGITLQFVQNVIVHGIKVHDMVPLEGGNIISNEDHYGFRTRSDGDGISIFGASNIWIDHVSMRKCSDGLIDMVQASTAITVSNCHFTDHNDVMLLGASDAHVQDKIMQVTIAFNHFGRGLVQRMPRIRWGFAHVVNNDFSQWLMYAVGGSAQSTIISQGNRYTAPINPSAKEVTKREFTPEEVWKSWTWRSEGDLMRRGAFFIQSGDPNIKKHNSIYSRFDMIKFKPGEYAGRLTRYAGALTCKIDGDC